MAQTNLKLQENNTEKQTAEKSPMVRIIQKKIELFISQIPKANNISELKNLFCNLCPTIEEKIVFISLFEEIFPNEKLVSKYLCKWLDENYLEEERQKQGNKNLNKYANLFNDTKLHSVQAAPVNSVAQSQFNNNYGLSDLSKNIIQREHKQSLLNKIKGLVKKLNPKQKARVSKVSSLELKEAGANIQRPVVAKSNDQNRLIAYNKSVAARAATQRAMAPSMSMGRAMSR